MECDIELIREEKQEQIEKIGIGHLEIKKDEWLISAEANISNGKFNFVVHNHNVGFNETETFLNLIKDEIDRLLTNKEKCPFRKQ